MVLRSVSCPKSDWSKQQSSHTFFCIVEHDLTVPLCTPWLQDLGVNSFEQLCINYANEQLQQFVTRAVISQEQVSRLCELERHTG